MMDIVCNEQTWIRPCIHHSWSISKIEAQSFMIKKFLSWKVEKETKFCRHTPFYNYLYDLNLPDGKWRWSPTYARSSRRYPFLPIIICIHIYWTRQIFLRQGFCQKGGGRSRRYPTNRKICSIRTTQGDSKAGDEGIPHGAWYMTLWQLRIAPRLYVLEYVTLCNQYLAVPLLEPSNVTDASNLNRSTVAMLSLGGYGALSRPVMRCKWVVLQWLHSFVLWSNSETTC